MAKKRPKVNLAQPVPPQSGDLEKLFLAPSDVEQASGLQLLSIRLEAIKPDPSQPRRTFVEESLQELSDSIRQDGVIQPIEVTEIEPNQYMIVHGERRWRAAQLAGLETIPAVVRRRDYDEVTRFVRQLVENIQREDLNDVDRAAGLLRLRDLMQEELKAAEAANVKTDEPWGSKITWAKVGKRLGHSRQRIHQLIQLLKLPDEIKDAVREGSLSERDTRIYQGLKPSQQRALHQARMAGDLSAAEAKKVAHYLKNAPDQTVYQAIRLLRQTPSPSLTSFTVDEPPFDPLFDENEETEAADLPPLPYPTDWSESGVNRRPGGPIDRLTWMRHHLNRIARHRINPAERGEILRLLHLVQKDIASLIAALEEG